MSKWNFFCLVRQIVCDKVSRTFYDNNSDEILEHFEKFEEDEIEESDIFAFCLGIILRRDNFFERDFQPPFQNFIKHFLDSYIIVEKEN